MPKFNATWMPESMDWDFSGFPGFEESEKGVIPEPTNQGLREFIRALQKLEEDGGAPALQPAEFIRRLMDEGIDEKFAKEEKQIAELIGEACANQPTAEQFLRLPDVAKAMFLDYLIRNWLNPNGRGAGSKESPKAPGNGASGTSSADTSASV